MTVAGWTRELFKLQVSQLKEGLHASLLSISYHWQIKGEDGSHKPVGESPVACGETLSPSQTFGVLFSCAGAEGAEKLGSAIGTAQ